MSKTTQDEQNAQSSENLSAEQSAQEQGARRRKSPHYPHRPRVRIVRALTKGLIISCLPCHALQTS